MRIRGRVSAIVAAAALVTVGFALPASAHTKTPPPSPGTASLAALLAADGPGFDNNWNDYDITDNAVSAVLKAKPSSPVAVLADGTVPVTAFLPTDRAFRNLAESVTGVKYDTESEVFTALATKLGIDAIESVLLYHVVPGSTITYGQAVRSNGAVLATALKGSTLTVKVKFCFFVSLKDADTDNRNAFIVQPNLNKGNLQIAHGISEVLRPVDLP